MPIERTILPDDTLVARCPTGYVQVKTVKPGVLFCRKVGKLPEGIFHAIIEPFNAGVATGSLDVYCDFTDFANYDSGYRVRWTEWIKRHPGKVKAMVYTPSKMVLMALSVINLVAHTFTTFASVEDLYAALARAAPGFHRQTLPRPFDKAG
jgi:hypothetical protein